MAGFFPSMPGMFEDKHINGLHRLLSLLERNKCDQNEPIFTDVHAPAGGAAAAAMEGGGCARMPLGIPSPSRGGH
jgi:hypothetical protein